MALRSTIHKLIVVLMKVVDNLPLALFISSLDVSKQVRDGIHNKSNIAPASGSISPPAMNLSTQPLRKK